MADRTIRCFGSFSRNSNRRTALAIAWAAGALFFSSCQDPLNPASGQAPVGGGLAVAFAISAGTYSLQAVHSGKCVDVSASNTANGANVQQWTCNGTKAQQWALRDLGNGVFEAKAAHSGKCADVAAWSTANGGNIHQWTCGGQNNQKWRVTDLGGGQHQFKSVHSGKCLDVSGAGTADGANIQQWTCYNVGQQKFKLVPVGVVPIDPPIIPVGSGFAAIVSEAAFNSMFQGRNPFYSYSGLVNATASYANFANEGDLATRKREAAAFLANVAHETGNLVYIEEINKGDYCGTDWSGRCACQTGKRYYGRGPIQLSWNYNYGAAGAALNLPLCTDPDLVARDAKVAWQTGLWFWMTQSGAGSRPGHASMVGGFGFGETIRTINGSLECNGGNPVQVQSRIDAYRKFCQMLGVDPGTNLGC
jgi:chitinase